MDLFLIPVILGISVGVSSIAVAITRSIYKFFDKRGRGENAK